MSYQAMTWAVKIKTGSGTLKGVLMAIANYVGQDFTCWYSQEKIAEDLEVSVKTVQRSLDTLEEMGLIERTRRQVNGKRTTDEIRLIQPDDTQSPRRFSTGQSVQPYTTLGPNQGDTESDIYKDEPTREPTREPTQGCEKDSSVDEEEIKRRIRNATGWQNTELDYAPIFKLLKSGASLEAHVLPVMERLADKAHTRSLKFFVSGIEAAMAKVPETPQDEPLKPDWELYVANFVKFAAAARARGMSVVPDYAWATIWGPRPGEKGCMAPPEILTKHGFAA
jgi:biotin operon repressor